MTASRIVQWADIAQIQVMHIVRHAQHHAMACASHQTVMVMILTAEAMAQHTSAAAVHSAAQDIDALVINV